MAYLISPIIRFITSNAVVTLSPSKWSWCHTAPSWTQSTFFLYQISWIFVVNQVPCVSSCWGTRHTPVVCNETREPPNSHYPSRPVTKNHHQITFTSNYPNRPVETAITVTKSFEKDNSSVAEKLWWWFESEIQSQVWLQGLSTFADCWIEHSAKCRAYWGFFGIFLNLSGHLLLHLVRERERRLITIPYKKKQLIWYSRRNNNKPGPAKAGAIFKAQKQQKDLQVSSILFYSTRKSKILRKKFFDKITSSKKWTEWRAGAR